MTDQLPPGATRPGFGSDSTPEFGADAESAAASGSFSTADPLPPADSSEPSEGSESDAPASSGAESDDRPTDAAAPVKRRRRGGRGGRGRRRVSREGAPEDGPAVADGDATAGGDEIGDEPADPDAPSARTTPTRTSSRSGSSRRRASESAELDVASVEEPPPEPADSTRDEDAFGTTDEVVAREDSSAAESATAEPDASEAGEPLLSEPRRPRRRRGGRRRGRRGAGAAEGAAGGAPAETVEPLPLAEAAEDNDAPPDDGDEFDIPAAAPAGPPENAARPAGRRRGRRRGRRGERAADGAESSQQSSELVSSSDDGEAPAPREGGSASNAGSPPASGKSGRGRRRRRRGGAGGASVTGPVGVESIPGEDDDLAGLDRSDDSDGAGEADAPAGGSRRGRRQPDGRRGEAPRREDGGKSGTKPQRSNKPASDADDVGARVKPGRPNIILVNASDREEIRVAVVENGQIVDFQMHVKRHETLVNDIYRGKVVNLETAIGAAFIDFGEGRNGFLHTSDVLSAYGEPDWSLDKLLTHKIDPEEWDEKSSQPHIGVELAESSSGRAAELEHEPHDADHEHEHDEDHDHDGHDDHHEHDEQHEAHARDFGDDELDGAHEHAHDEGELELVESAFGDDSLTLELVEDDGDDAAPGSEEDAEDSGAVRTEDDHSDASSDDVETSRLRSRRPQEHVVSVDGGGDDADPIGFAPSPAESTGGAKTDDAPANDRRASAVESKPTPAAVTVKEPPKSGGGDSKRSGGKDRRNGGGPGGRRGKDSGDNANRRQGRHRARPRLPITDLLDKGQSVVVQVTKDAIGDKGPTLTTYISIPGRYLVLMPSMSRTGVSRKIEDEKERRRLKRILESLDVPQGMGVIVRTAGIGCSREDL